MKKVKSVIIVIIILIISFILMNMSMCVLYRASYTCKYSEYVENYSTQHKIEKNLIYSVIRSESRFNPQAVSNIGARGLMQITQETFDWAKSKLENDDGYTYKDIFDPNANIKYGTHILSLLLTEFENEKTALAAYHAGWGNVKNWLNNREHSQDGYEIDFIPFNNTQTYVNQVLNTKQIYGKLYDKK